MILGGAAKQRSLGRADGVGDTRVWKNNDTWFLRLEFGLKVLDKNSGG